MSNGSTSAEKAKWKSLRSTPRRLAPEELHQRAVARRDARRALEKYLAGARRASAEGDYARKQKARAKLRKAYRSGLRKNAELGINPVYIGGLGPRAVLRGSTAHKEWLKASRDWDRAHDA